MAKIKGPVELVNIVRALDISIVAGLAKIAQDPDTSGALVFVLNAMHGEDSKKIVRNAGGVVSMDTMVNNVVDSSFYRGRISLGVLIKALIINSPHYLEVKAEQKPKKRKDAPRR